MEPLGELRAEKDEALDEIDAPAVLPLVRLGIDVRVREDPQRFTRVRVHPERQLGEAEQIGTARHGRIGPGARAVSCLAEPTVENADGVVRRHEPEVDQRTPIDEGVLLLKRLFVDGALVGLVLLVERVVPIWLIEVVGPRGGEAGCKNGDDSHRPQPPDRTHVSHGFAGSQLR